MENKNRSRYNKTTLSTIFGYNEEKGYIVVCQVFIPFMIAAFGMAVAGLVLEHVQELNVFKEITEIYILVPALLGLKGNLEMALASRLSTQANIGNIILTQLQAIVVDFIVALVSLAIGWVPQGHFNLRHALVLCNSSVSTASITSLALGVGDNLVAVQVSRLSTTFHQQGKPGEFQDITQYHASKICPNSYKIFCSTRSNSSTTRVLLYHD
ncbi:unnamed protein product [Adineta steineri]|uniref:SLC41A/MgtE integral membrane domain-containing protein n=1 Tax=Adineta steineri TaxID=433720 RepID=A0A816CY01_9BILA|nr:unnamed protein product [Adineta steineri]CAF1446216.1 unnamed protein product [Adineta steineri]CAF1629159.1 unnamed protein product [Adineta steineri]CAF1629180.1 unnamed protein product [Adineta steineri]